MSRTYFFSSTLPNTLCPHGGRRPLRRASTSVAEGCRGAIAEQEGPGSKNLSAGDAAEQVCALEATPFPSRWKTILLMPSCIQHPEACIRESHRAIHQNHRPRRFRRSLPLCLSPGTKTCNWNTSSRRSRSNQGESCKGTPYPISIRAKSSMRKIYPKKP
jgi:hypothetical protein